MSIRLRSTFWSPSTWSDVTRLYRAPLLARPVLPERFGLLEHKLDRRVLKVGREPVPAKDRLHHHPDLGPHRLADRPVHRGVLAHRCHEPPRDDPQLGIAHRTQRALIVRQRVVEGLLLRAQPQALATFLRLADSPRELHQLLDHLLRGHRAAVVRQSSAVGLNMVFWFPHIPISVNCCSDASVLPQTCSGFVTILRVACLAGTELEPCINTCNPRSAVSPANRPSLTHDRGNPHRRWLFICSFKMSRTRLPRSASSRAVRPFEFCKSVLATASSNANTIA
jgi:hypothetical protein